MGCLIWKRLPTAMTGSVEGDQAGDRGGPFRPSLNVAEHLPHQGRRCVDLHAALSNHVPDGTSIGGPAPSLIRSWPRQHTPIGSPHGLRVASQRFAPDPVPVRRCPVAGRRTGAAARRVLRADLEQHHLRRAWRSDEVLGFLPGIGSGLGKAQRVGLRPRRGIATPRSGAGHARLRLPAVRQPPAGRPRPHQREGVRRRRPAPRGAAVGLPGLPRRPDRPRLLRRSRGRTHPLLSTVLHVFPHR